MRTFAPTRNLPRKQASSTPARPAVPRSQQISAFPSSARGLQLDFSRIPAIARPLQRKLTVSAPGDSFEREADEVAEKVMRMAEPASAGAGPAAIQRKCAECAGEDEKKRIHTKPAVEQAGTAPAAPDTAAAVSAAEQGGAPLSREVRAYFEPRLQHDFSRVRVHADRQAAEAAQALRARAFTLGRHIVFGAGQYAPATVGGKRLLAHELVHVLQQAVGASPSARPEADARIARETSEEDEKEAQKQAAATTDPASAAEAKSSPDAAPQAGTGPGKAAISAGKPAAASPAAAPPTVTPGGHTPAPAGMAVCPDAPQRSVVVVGCTAKPAAPPPAAEKAVLPSSAPKSFGGDADRAKFAQELAQCHAEREVKKEIEKRFGSDVATAKKSATAQAKADTEAAIKGATEGLDLKDKKAVNSAKTQAAAEAKKAAAKKIAEAQAAIKRQDVAAVTAELAAEFEAELAADYDETIKGALARYKTLEVMQAKLNGERKRITREQSAPPKARKGETPPSPKTADQVAAKVEAEMVQVRCDQEEWGLNQLEGFSRAWAVGRREQVDFLTIPQKASYLQGLKPTYDPAAADWIQIPTNLQGDKDMPGVAPEMADFLTQLAADPKTPPFTADNYPGHGLGAWANKGFSVDLRLKGPHDARGFWQHSAAVLFLLSLDATAKKLGARWRVLYNDFGVAQEVNQKTGSRNVEFVGGSGKGQINWHGPYPLILHFHLDLEIPRKKDPAAGAQP